MLLLHGLGGTRASLFQTAAALAPRYRVHVPDLPGFGSSSKPPFGGYNASWFSSLMLGLMGELDMPRAYVVGNSMGGRVAIEMGLVAPERIAALALLCPAVAWIRRGLHPIVRLLRPEFCPLRLAVSESRGHEGTRVEIRLAYGVAGSGLPGWLAERVAAPAVSSHLRRSLRQLKRVVEYEQLRERAAHQRSP